MTSGPKQPGPAADNAGDWSVPGWARLHLWQMQPVRDVLVGLAVLGLLWLGQKTSIVTVPLLLAGLLAYLFEPVIRWVMRRLRVARRSAVVLVMAAVGLIVVVPSVLGAVYGSVQLIGFGRDTAEKALVVRDAIAAPTAAKADEEFAKWATARGLEGGAAAFPGFWRSIHDGLRSADADGTAREAFDAVAAWLVDNKERVATTVAQGGRDVLGVALRLAGGTAGLGFMLFITAFFFYFVAEGWPKIGRLGTKLLPDKNKARVIHLLSRFDGVINAFIRGRLTIAFVQAVVFSIGYWIIGVPAAFILGPFVAVLSIVPYLALVGVPISIALLALEGHAGVRGAWWWVVGMPILVYLIGQWIDDYVLTPIIQGKNTGLDTPVILFASLAGGALFGVFGLLIAIPIAACVKILIAEVFWPKFKAWAEGRAADPLPIE
jgi:predicted PurR-regulated permease PerM